MRRKLSSAAKKFFILLLVFCTVRAAVFFGADEAAHTAALAAAQSEETVSFLLNLGFGSAAPKEESDIALKTLFSESPQLRSDRISETDEDTETEEKPYYTAPDEPDVSETNTTAEPVSSAETDSDNGELSTASTDSETVETTITGETGYYGADGIYLSNRTDYDIDIAAMLAEPIDFALDISEPEVLIIHTHGSEAFTQNGDDVYEESDPWRTEDMEHSVISLGDTLAEALTERGITVLHDRALYDYPSYSGSYTRSAEAIEGYLGEYPDIKIVIDLHRDALMDDNGTVYKTVADINGEKCAQVMLVLGTDFSGLDHPEWRENMKLALRLQATMNEKYPTLARPITISQYRYNQNLTTGSLLIEIGCNGNTLAEARAATEYFADSAADVLNDFAQ